MRVRVETWKKKPPRVTRSVKLTRLFTQTPNTLVLEWLFMIIMVNSLLDDPRISLASTWSKKLKPFVYFKLFVRYKVCIWVTLSSRVTRRLLLMSSSSSSWMFLSSDPSYRLVKQPSLKKKLFKFVMLRGK